MTNLTAAEIRASAPVAFVELAKAGVTAIAMPGAGWEDLSGEGIEFACKLVRETLARAAKGDQVDREEIAFWRRDLSARLFFDTTLLEHARSAGNEAKVTALAARIRSALAAYHAAEYSEWHERCDLCGDFVLPGEESAASEDVSGHARCMIEGHVDAGPPQDTSEADLEARVEAATKLLDQLNREPLPPAMFVVCEGCSGTGSWTLGRGQDNDKDTCRRCGGSGKLDLATGQTPAASFMPETIHVPV